MKRIAALVLVALFATGCGGAVYVPKTPQETAQYTTAIATRTLNGLKDLGGVASELRKAEQTIHANKGVTDEWHAKFEGRRCDVPPVPTPCVESGFLKVQHKADDAIDKISKADVTISQIAAAVQPVWDASSELQQFTAGGQLSYATMMAILRGVLALIGVK